MALSCSEVSAGPGEVQVLLVGPPPGVRSKGQGRALRRGLLALDSLGVGSRRGGVSEGRGFAQTQQPRARKAAFAAAKAWDS